MGISTDDWLPPQNSGLSWPVSWGIDWPGYAFHCISSFCYMACKCRQYRTSSSLLGLLTLSQCIQPMHNNAILMPVHAWLASPSYSTNSALPTNSQLGLHADKEKASCVSMSHGHYALSQGLWCEHQSRWQAFQDLKYTQHMHPSHMQAPCAPTCTCTRPPTHMHTTHTHEHTHTRLHTSLPPHVYTQAHTHTQLTRASTPVHGSWPDCCKTAVTDKPTGAWVVGVGEASKDKESSWVVVGGLAAYKTDAAIACEISAQMMACKCSRWLGGSWLAWSKVRLIGTTVGIRGEVAGWRALWPWSVLVWSGTPLDERRDVTVHLEALRTWKGKPVFESSTQNKSRVTNNLTQLLPFTLQRSRSNEVILHVQPQITWRAAPPPPCH